jgi:hypothetical protein
MREQAEINKIAWEYRTDEYMNAKAGGSPAEVAANLFYVIFTLSEREKCILKQSCMNAVFRAVIIFQKKNVILFQKR